MLRKEDGQTRLYSLVHNREHDNVSWMFGELERFAPQEDSLTVRAGVLGAYPNMFFVVPETEIEAFSTSVADPTGRLARDLNLSIQRNASRRR